MLQLCIEAWEDDLAKGYMRLLKPFLKTVGNRTMIQLTVDRINHFVSLENIYMVTNKSHVQNINEQLPEIDHENILIEPLIKETDLFRIKGVQI